MSIPIEKPDYRAIAAKVMLMRDPKQLETLLSDLYEHGYHIGLIYGGWEYQDSDKNYASQFEPIYHSGCPCSHQDVEGVKN